LLTSTKCYNGVSEGLKSVWNLVLVSIFSFDEFTKIWNRV